MNRSGARDRQHLIDKRLRHRKGNDFDRAHHLARYHGAHRGKAGQRNPLVKGIDRVNLAGLQHQHSGILGE